MKARSRRPLGKRPRTDRVPDLRLFRAELSDLRHKTRELGKDRRRLLAHLETHRSETRFIRKAAQTIAHSAELPMIEVADGKVRSWNAPAARMFGYPPEQILGKSLSCLCPKDSRSGITALWEQSKLGKRVDGRELRCSRKDHGQFDAFVTAVPRFSRNGRVLRITLLFRDLRRRQAEEALYQLVESSGDAIVGQDLEGAILSWNRGAERIFGYSAGEALGRPHAIIVPPNETDPAASLIEQARRGGPARSLEAVRLRRDGRKIIVAMTISPTFDPQGNVVGVSVIARDVTERRRAERELERKTAALARTNTELELFTAAAAHDLQEPVRKVLTFASRVAAGKLDEAQRHGVDRILDSARRMTALIEGLLTYSRVSTGPLRSEPLDLRETLESTLLKLAPQIKERKAKIKAEGLPSIRGDRHLMAQLFEQLIANSLKFSGDRTPVISIKARRSTGGVRIVLRDNGIGFERRYREKIFAPFQRLNLRESFSGSGLGLALCRRIMERHGGTITASSSPGRGAKFTVTMPTTKP